MSFDPSTYDFDRFLRYDDMVIWLQHAAERRPDLITLETYGHSYEGRKLWVAAITDSSTGSHESKPAHWVDANIHAVEVTGGVAALHLIHHLMTGAETNDPMVVQALRTRTFYVAPRVNPDGVEAALADRPMFHRSSVRSWPWTDGHRWPGLHAEDVDGDGRILTMRIADPDGSWVEHPDDPRVMVPVPLDGMTDRPRYRLLAEGRVVDYDGYTVPTPRDPSGLDLNRNFPAGWSTTVTGSGDHPMSEPEIDALVRAVRARTNVCGYNAYHTFGGVLLRPSSTKPDSSLSPADVWTWNEFGKRGTEGDVALKRRGKPDPKPRRLAQAGRDLERAILIRELVDEREQLRVEEIVGILLEVPFEHPGRERRRAGSSRHKQGPSPAQGVGGTGLRRRVRDRFERGIGGDRSLFGGIATGAIRGELGAGEPHLEPVDLVRGDCREHLVDLGKDFRGLEAASVVFEPDRLCELHPNLGSADPIGLRARRRQRRNRGLE